MIDPFHYVFSAYTDPRRQYHDIRHIIVMLNLAYLFGDPKIARDPTGYFLKRELYEAILFHDYVYEVVPGVVSNEALSSSAYLKYHTTLNGADMSYDPYVVARMIEATEHHFDGELYDDYLTNLLLDLDLFSFTLPYDEFEAINVRIDNEFIPTYGESLTWRNRYAFIKHIHDGGLLMYRVIDKDGKFADKAYSNMKRWLSENDHWLHN